MESVSESELTGNLWNLDDPRDLPNKYAADLAVACEYHDNLGMLQSWGFDRRDSLMLVFEHGIVYYAPLWRPIYEIPLYQRESRI